jgi:hypothetical protein
MFYLYDVKIFFTAKVTGQYFGNTKKNIAFNYY